MRIVGIFLAALAVMFGVRLLGIAMRTVFSGKVMVRQGVRSRWEPAPSPNDVWKIALRDAIMGLLLIVLGIVLLT